MVETTSRKRIIGYLAALFVSLIIIALAATVHIQRTEVFNKLDRIGSGDEPSDACGVEIVQSGLWPKDDSKIKGVNTGAEYDITVTNVSEYDISDWTLRINILGDCYLNQAWNGTVEVHQHAGERGENVQLLDLHNFDFDYDDVSLEYVGRDKNNLMIHLYPGDYIIYYPASENGGSSGEKQLAAYVDTPGMVTCGIIFYYAKSIDLTDFEYTYHFDKSQFQGIEFYILLAALLGWLFCLMTFIIWLAVRRKADRELREREAMLDESLDLISHFVDAKDPYTNGHSERVSQYAYKLAKELGFSQRQARYVYYAGILHDVGKCYVPNEILKKPGRLDDEEYHNIQNHTVNGYEMLKNIKSIPGIADGAYYHHERYDGKGYPTGLAGESIPIIARIICVADAFDAMNSNRCYRTHLTRESIINEIAVNKGKQFDPKVADAMLRLIESGEIELE